MPSEPMELIFPLKGINDTWAFGRQPEGTCPDAQNVLPFDPLDSRARGGQRWGISKYFDNTVSGSNAIQRIDCIVKSITGGSSSTTDTFTQANGQLSGIDWANFEDSGVNYVDSATHPIVNGNKILFNSGNTPGRRLMGALHKTAKISGDTFVLSAKVSWTLDAASSPSMKIGLCYGAPNATFPMGKGSIRQAEIKIYAADGDDPITLVASIDQTKGNTSYPMTPGSDDYLDPAWWAEPRTIELRSFDGGRTLSLYVEDTLLRTDSGYFYLPSGYNYVGFIVDFNDATDNTITFDDWTLTQTEPISGRSPTLIAVAGGDVYAGRLASGLSLATNGDDAVNASGRVDTQPAFGKTYFADNDPAHYKYLDNDDNTMYTWTPTAGTLPMGSDETAVDITAATPGTPSFTIAEDWSARAVGDYLLVAGSTANDGYYTIAGVAGAGPTVLTVNEAVPDNDVSGTIQYQNLACKINCLYRGRVVMTGLKSDPQNWFMSVAGDPLDWDYGATISAIMAVAGNSTDAGKCADIITCLAPYSDDLLFIGGDHTLWLMRGDPAERGRIDNISYQTGISGPDAFAFDPNGIFYFFGSGTLWRMAAGGVPEALSRNRMDQVFKNINLIANTVHLMWDNARHGLFIFVVPSTERPTIHYYWDERTDSFWKLIFPDVQGPTTTYAFDGDSPDDNALLMGGWDGYIRHPDSTATSDDGTMGGWDGYIRHPDSTATSDDGTAIDSYVLYPPIAVGGSLRNTRINSVTAVLDTESDDVVMTMYAEDTVQKTIESATIRLARTLSAGRL